eukprot:35732-Eustigmatos_ZCMA.PRE.1
MWRTCRRLNNEAARHVANQHTRLHESRYSMRHPSRTRTLNNSALMGSCEVDTTRIGRKESGKVLGIVPMRYAAASQRSEQHVL